TSRIFTFNDTQTTKIYTLSLHDALPILSGKKGSGLWLSLTVTAARTIVSPKVTRAEPAACFAMRPVSMTMGRPANVRSMRSIIRSEEHTSELQSRSDLVCRLLLEKKNMK